MNRFDESFKSKLVGIEFETIENTPHSVYALSPDFKLIYFNKAWFDFAKSNNGEPDISIRFHLNSDFDSGLSGLMKDYYTRSFTEVMRKKEVCRHEYECSSASNYRLYSQDVYPLKNGNGIIIINSLLIDRIIDEGFRKISTLSISNYEESNGMITQCSNCRKTNRNDSSEIWDWVPSLVEEIQKNINNSICPVCYDYYYK